MTVTIGPKISDKYVEIEFALCKSGRRTIRMVKDDEIIGIQTYGADRIDLSDVVGVLCQFDEKYNIGFSLDTNNSLITIV